MLKNFGWGVGWFAPKNGCTCIAHGKLGAIPWPAAGEEKFGVLFAINGSINRIGYRSKFKFRYCNLGR